MEYHDFIKQLAQLEPIVLLEAYFEAKTGKHLDPYELLPVETIDAVYSLKTYIDDYNTANLLNGLTNTEEG